jgi:hypothetical protein
MWRECSNCKKLCSTWEATSFSYTQEFPKI